jgi:hypothetical protein
MSPAVKLIQNLLAPESVVTRTLSTAVVISEVFWHPYGGFVAAASSSVTVVVG